MHHRPRILPSLAAAFLVAATLVHASSCALSTYGSEPQDRALCSVDAHCDDGNPCTLDACGPDGLCAAPVVQEGLFGEQVVGDCKLTACKDGALVDSVDENDKPDDINPCTIDACTAGVPTFTPLAAGAECKMGDARGTCQAGACFVECSPLKGCDDGNPCTEDSCDLGVGACVFSVLDGLPTPGVTPVAGDCKKHVCVGDKDTQLNDNADLPDDKNPCTIDVCTAGVPSNPPSVAGALCAMGQPQVCDGAGTCVMCINPSDCVNLPPDDECQKRTCVSNQCGQSFTKVGTPLALQEPGDCKEVVCGGDGSTKVEEDNADIPEDNNACTKDSCTGGTPANTNLNSGASCGGTLICDGQGVCVGCNVASDCAGTDDFCKKRTCAANKTCGWEYTKAGTALPDGQTAKDCKVLVCDGKGNVEPAVDLTDKPVDGLDCTQDLCSAVGEPSNPPTVLNSVCNNNGGQVCDGKGACKKAQSKACGAAGECLSGQCVDNVCCDMACSGDCKSCDVPGSVGTCTSEVKGEEDGTCTGTKACNGLGACKLKSSETCVAAADCVSGFCVDGVCCASACDGKCRTCGAPGSLGQCVALKDTEDTGPLGTCEGTSACDAAGVCKLKEKESCTANADCLSAHCVDGFCCDKACNGLCEACSSALKGGGPNGVCGPVKSGTNPNSECGADVCNEGICVKNNGATCALNTDCLSAHCADSVCCNTACTADCYACNLNLTVGTCSPVPAGWDDGACVEADGLTCNGAGSCRGDTGATCNMADECASGVCTSMACDVASLCDNNDCGGLCAKCANGEACAVDTDCLSGSCVNKLCQ